MVRVVDSGWADVGNAFTQSFRGAGDSYLKGVLTRSQYEQNMASAGKTQAELDQLRAREAIVKTRKAEIAKQYGPEVADDWEVMFQTGHNPSEQTDAFFKSRGGYGVMSAPPTGANRRDMQLYTGANPTTGVDAGERAADDAAEIARVRAQQELANVGGAEQERLRQAGLAYRQTQEPLKLGQSETGFVPKPQQEALGLPSQTVRGSGAGTNFMVTDANGKPTGQVVYSPDGVNDATGKPLPSNRAEMTKDPAGLLAGQDKPPLGNSIEAFAWDEVNKYRLKKQSGAPTSPTEDLNYAAAYQHLRDKGQYQYHDVDVGDGYKQPQWTKVPDTGVNLGAYPLPPDLIPQQKPPPSAGQGTLPAPPPPLVGDQTSAPTPGQTGQGPSIAPNAPPDGMQTAQGGAGNGNIPAGPVVRAPQTDQGRNIEYGASVLSYNVPRVIAKFERQPDGRRWSPSWWATYLENVSQDQEPGWIGRAVEMLTAQGAIDVDEDTIDYMNSVAAAQKAILRLESGMAILSDEDKSYNRFLFPQPRDAGHDNIIDAKLERLNRIAAIREKQAGKITEAQYARLLAQEGIHLRLDPTKDPEHTLLGPAPPALPVADRPPRAGRPASTFEVPGGGAAAPPPAAAAPPPPPPPVTAPQGAPKPKLQWDPKTGTVIEVR